MTYGWAILIVIIVAAALWALGIFNPSTWTQGGATGFAGFQVSEWRVNGTGALFVLKTTTANAQIETINATYGTNNWGNLTTILPLAPNSQKVVYLAGTGGPSQGASYSVKVDISYRDLNSQLPGSLSSTGTLSGTAVA